jgi:glycoside/pentoside/hexuronide:cation symporter, GPH family
MQIDPSRKILRSAGLSWLDGFRYGLLGLPLAFCALPLYVLLPNLYAREFGVPLAALGMVLLGSRLFDAAIDPLLGRLCDRLFAHSLRSVLIFGALAVLLLFIGFGFLFFPLVRNPDAMLLTTSLLLVVTYAAYSGLAVAHQSWGAMLGGDETKRGRIVAWREGLGLIGVVLASVTPSLLGLPALVSLFGISLAIGWLTWTQSPRPMPGDPRSFSATSRVAGKPPSLWHPWRNSAFRHLLAVFLLNGIASAIPATLVLFFVQDRIQAGEATQPLFLASFFICGAASMPLWLKSVQHFGLARCWLGGMILSIAVFLTALFLGAGDSVAFFAVCALSGVALGSDLALPAALLAGIIDKAGDRGKAEGSYFGWWNFATKLNLALAAGLALPLLAAFGYGPGARNPAALQALTLAYCLLPCVLKTLAAALLYRLFIRPKTPT